MYDDKEKASINIRQTQTFTHEIIAYIIMVDVLVNIQQSWRA